MKLSTKGQRLRKQYADEHGLGYVNTYFTAVLERIDTYFFPIQLDVRREDLINEDVSWVSEWLKLWPKQSKTGLAYAVSGQLPQCKARMSKLLKQIEEYGIQDVTQEKVFDATYRYLRHQEERNWDYTKKAHKFILDNDGSELANWLQSEATVKKQFYL